MGTDIVTSVMTSRNDRLHRQQRRRRLVAVVILVAMVGAAISGAVAGFVAVVRSDSAPAPAHVVGTFAVDADQVP